jgi:hypothetical protein
MLVTCESLVPFTNEALPSHERDSVLDFIYFWHNLLEGQPRSCGICDIPPNIDKLATIINIKGQVYCA